MTWEDKPSASRRCPGRRAKVSRLPMLFSKLRLQSWPTVVCCSSIYLGIYKARVCVRGAWLCVCLCVCVLMCHMYAQYCGTHTQIWIILSLATHAHTVTRTLKHPHALPLPRLRSHILARRGSRQRPFCIRDNISGTRAPSFGGVVPEFHDCCLCYWQVC